MTEAREENTMTGYLDEAAAELRKARAANEKRALRAAEMETAGMRTDDIRREVAIRNMELADGFTRLAAIERGLPPAMPPADAGADGTGL